jgi:hypothetical protein
MKPHETPKIGIDLNCPTKPNSGDFNYQPLSNQPLTLDHCTWLWQQCSFQTNKGGLWDIAILKSRMQKTGGAHAYTNYHPFPVTPFYLAREDVGVRLHSIAVVPVLGGVPIATASLATQRPRRGGWLWRCTTDRSKLVVKRNTSQRQRLQHCLYYGAFIKASLVCYFILHGEKNSRHSLIQPKSAFCYFAKGKGEPCIESLGVTSCRMRSIFRFVQVRRKVVLGAPQRHVPRFALFKCGVNS